MVISTFWETAMQKDTACLPNISTLGDKKETSQAQDTVQNNFYLKKMAASPCLITIQLGFAIAK